MSATVRFHPQVAEAIDSLRDTTRFEILPIPYDFDESNPQALKSLRWVLYDEAFLCSGSAETGPKGALR